MAAVEFNFFSLLVNYPRMTPWKMMRRMTMKISQSIFFFFFFFFFFFLIVTRVHVDAASWHCSRRRCIVALLAIRSAIHRMGVLSLDTPVPVQLYVGNKIGRPESHKKHLHSHWISPC